MMDSEFPDPDDEFNLAHEDDFELLKEIEELEEKKRKESKKPATSSQNPEEKSNSNTYLSLVHKELNSVTSNVHKELNSVRSNVHKELNNTPTNNYNEECIPSTSTFEPGDDNLHTDVTKKRNYDKLFGDMVDMYDFNEFANIQEPKEKKPRWDHPEDVIKAVLDAREKFHEHNRGVTVNKKQVEIKRDSISLRVPKWNFIAVTRSYDAQRIYVRVKSNQERNLKIGNSEHSNLLSVPYSQLKEEAEKILENNATCYNSKTPNRSTGTIKHHELWVEKYRPRSYVELLSDESVNRNLLHWLKLWDKVVFHKNYVDQRKKKINPMFKRREFMNNNSLEDVPELDNRGFPIQRIVLLSGPPGLGKTTLAHLAAQHAGYKVVEINASDERSPDAFRQILLASTQMKAVMGNDPRPNCLVLDEIDGAPVASIELLLKFIQGKLVSKGKKEKAKGDKQSNICYRPVICICNEPYTPSLRPLRAIALIIPVPEVTPARLADRLMEISKKENIKVNADALLHLAEISGCDIRSCLGALQYMGGVKLGDNLSFALKDSRKNLFDSWKQILTIPMTRNGILPTTERARLVLKTVQRGESEKLMQGVFHNYPEICNEKFNYIVTCLEWFQFYDEVMSLVINLQVWSLMPYTNYAFVAWHLYFARARNAKLSYPSIMYEIHQKQVRTMGILNTIQRNCRCNSLILAVDIAPYLPDLLCPRLRTVSGHLHSTKEREDISRLVNILLEFGLTFVQEKNLHGTYDYKLDPDIFDIGIFPGCKHRRTLLYAVKQIIVQELEAERVRRLVNMVQRNSSKQNKSETTLKKTETTENPKNLDVKNEGEKSRAPNTTEKIKKVEKELKEITYKDFFGRIIKVNQDKPEPEKQSTNSRHFLTKSGVWYKYKEGFSNAVRRSVIMGDLL